jgi:uncharacterized protein YdeI (YjbR/CyaY-like superfamily)
VGRLTSAAILTLIMIFRILKNMSEPQFFSSIRELRAWFKKNHKKEKELWIGFYKKNSGLSSVSYPEAVDTALCFGWIDGIRKSINDVSYTNRFTPRNPKSNWSNINIKKAEELIKLGVMEPAGLTAFKKRKDTKTGIYSFEKEEIILNEDYRIIFMKNKKAWKYFEAQPPSYKKTAVHWVISARKEETRLKRLEILISSSENQERIPLLRRNIPA